MRGKPWMRLMHNLNLAISCVARGRTSPPWASTAQPVKWEDSRPTVWVAEEFSLVMWASLAEHVAQDQHLGNGSGSQHWPGPINKAPRKRT